MNTKAMKERAEQLIDRLSTDKAKLILDLIERFNEKEEEGATSWGEHTLTEIWEILGKVASQDIGDFETPRIDESG